MDWITRLLKNHPEQRLAGEALGRLRAVPPGETRTTQAEQAFDEVVRSCAPEPGPAAELVRAAARGLPSPLSGRVYEAGLSALEKHAAAMGGSLPALALHLYDQALKDADPGARGAALGSLLGELEHQGVPGSAMARTMLGATRLDSLERPMLEGLEDGATPAGLATRAVESVDGKAQLATLALGQLESTETTPFRRGVAGLGRAILEGSSFRETRAALAGPALSPLVQPDELDGPGLARSLEAWLDKAETGDSSIGRYVDDKGTVAREGLRFLESQAPEEAVRKLAGLTRTAVDSVNFSKSVEAVARRGLSEIQDGGQVDDARLARTTRALLEKALNANTAGGRFQADKSRLIRGVLPWLQAELKEEPSQRLLALWSQAVSRTTFADTDARVAEEALRALEAGQADDRALGQLALRMTERAEAGQTSSYAYADDKSRVALQSAGALQGLLRSPDSQAVLGFFQHAMNGVSFTSTVAKSAALAFERVAEGAPADPRSLARLGAGLVKGASDSRATDGRFYPDSCTVAGNVADHLERLAASPEERAAAAMVKAAAKEVSFVESARAAAKIGLGALAEGRCRDRGDLARVATDILRKGEVGESKQDRGPLAAAMAATLSRSGLDPEPTALALTGLEGMLRNGVDHEIRTAAAERALAAWAAGETPSAGRMAEVALAGVKEPRDRRTMLEGAVRTVALRNGDKAGARAAEGLRAARSDEGALRRLLDEVAALTPSAEEVRKLAEGLAPQPEAPTVQDDDEWVVIGSVRLRKSGGG